MAKREFIAKKKYARVKKPKRFVYRERVAVIPEVPKKNVVWLNRPDDGRGSWGDYDASFTEERASHRIMELEFLLNLIQSGTALQKLYANLLAAALINSYQRTSQGAYPQALREAGVEIKMDLREATIKQKV